MMEFLGLYMALVVVCLVAIPWLAIMCVPFIILGIGATMPLIYFFQGPLGRLGAKRTKRILVADDDPISILPLLGALYSDEDVDICYVERGADAVSELQKKSYDLVILDMSMPDMTGVDVLFKSDGQGFSWGKSLPVVFYTSNKRLADNVYDMDFRKFDVRDVWDKDTPVGAVDKLVKVQLAAL